MRIVWLGHACHLIECGDVRVLMDPWLTDPIYEGRVERDPPLAFGPADLPPIDVLALTHGHLDHFNAPTLALLPDKTVPVVHPPVTFTELDSNLRHLGFTNLHPRDDWEPFEHRGVRITPTPSLGVLDECAYRVDGEHGSFWNGADAPQPPEVTSEIARRLGPVDIGAFSHNSFDAPALLGLPSFKDAGHGPAGGAAAARTLGARYAFGAASNMRWRGPDASEVTTKVIRRHGADFAKRLAAEAPDTRLVDLRPGDAWSRAGGIKRAAMHGTAPAPVHHDFIHPLLETGRRWSAELEPTTEATFRRDLPALTAARCEASRYVGQPICFEIEGDDSGTFTVDFREPGSVPEATDSGAPFALRVPCDLWRDLFTRRVPWQSLIMSDRLRVTRVRRGAPPDGLHCVFALQAVFP